MISRFAINFRRSSSTLLPAVVAICTRRPSLASTRICEYDVDGSILDSASRDGVVNLSPEPDFINTIRVSGATFDAAKGRYSGAWVQVFTTPGTNSFHSTASEYFTNNNLTARTEFQYCAPDAAGCEAIPAFRRNEFGGTFGGPIIKNKLFFFVVAFGLLSSNASTIITDVEAKDFVQYVQQNFPNSLANTFFSEAPPSVYPSSNILTGRTGSTAKSGLLPATSFPADLPVAGLIDVPLSLTHNAYQWHIRNAFSGPTLTNYRPMPVLSTA